MSKNNPTKADVAKAWSDHVDKPDQYDIFEVTGADGTEQFQVVDKDNGSICAAAGSLQTLLDRVGDPFIEAAVAPVEAADKRNEKRFTSRGQLASPTQPEVLEDLAADPVEIDNKSSRRSATETAEKSVTRGRRRAKRS